MLGLPTLRSLFRHLCFRRLRDLSWTRSQKIMQNEAGDYVDMYTPRKCSVTNRVIAAKDHASVQLNVGEIDETGRFTGNFKTYALCGSIRQMGEADDALTRLCIKDGIVNKNYNS